MATLREKMSDVLRELERRFASARDEERKKGPRARPLPPGVARAYADLELAPDATLEQARSAWKRLVLRYHPDKFAKDPKKLAVATRVTAKLTAAWDTVRGHLELKRP